MTGMRWLRLRAVAAIVALGVTIGVGGAVQAATRPTDSPRSSAASQQFPPGAGTYTLLLPNSRLQVIFGSPTPSANGPTPDAYTVQYVQVTDQGEGLNSAFRSTISGDWQYNGTYAYVWGSTPKCSSDFAAVTTCGTWNNGVKMPAAMHWEDEGFAVIPTVVGILPYDINIYLYGSGSHSVSVSGP